MSAQAARTVDELHTVDPISAAVTALHAGRPVLVADDATSENEYDVILPAALAEPRWTAWTVRHTSGLLRVPLTAERADALSLPPMVDRNQDPRGTAYDLRASPRHARADPVERRALRPSAVRRASARAQQD